MRVVEIYKNPNYQNERQYLSEISANLRDIKVLLKSLVKALMEGHEPPAQGATRRDGESRTPK